MPKPREREREREREPRPAAAPREPPPSLDGSRSLEFVATKKVGVPGKNGGSWLIEAKVRVGKKVVFDRRSTLVFGLNDNADARDAECLAQLRGELAEVWHRMTCSSKDTCRLVPGRHFDGSRSLRITAKKSTKNKKFNWTCASSTTSKYANTSRLSSDDYVSDTDAARASAAALRMELAQCFLHVTRGQTEPYEDAPASTNDENQAPSRGALRYLKDVYGATSNLDAVVTRSSDRAA